MELDRAKGFVFDLDGTLIQRARRGFDVLPGAREILAALRASGRPSIVCTNASHVAPEVIARELREDGLDVRDEEVVTPICSAISYLQRRHAGAPVLLFGSGDAGERMAAAGVRLVEGDAAEHAAVVMVAHPDVLDFEALELGARAITRGARLLTGSYVPAYSGADGPIFSRGSMTTAALAKATSVRPAVVGKPSTASVREVSERMGVAPADQVVVGDDVKLDIALGRLGGSHTILVRSGISADLDLDRVPAGHRPHEVVDGVEDLLARL